MRYHEEDYKSIPHKLFMRCFRGCWCFTCGKITHKTMSPHEEGNFNITHICSECKTPMISNAYDHGHETILVKKRAILPTEEELKLLPE